MPSDFVEHGLFLVDVFNFVLVDILVDISKEIGG